MAYREAQVDDKTTVGYSCDTSGIGYSVISDEIKHDFDFLNTTLFNKLDELNNQMTKAAGMDKAFAFDNTINVEAARADIESEVSKCKTLLQTLHSALYKDVDNVNGELEDNFGWVILGKLCKKTTTKN